MKDETVRKLVNAVGVRHGFEIGRVQVFEGKRNLLGKATKTANLGLSITIANRKESNNLANAINVLDTIIHEFAHIFLISQGVSNGHNEEWESVYFGYLLDDYKALVELYNFLEGEDLPYSFMQLVTYSSAIKFNKPRFISFLRENGQSIDEEYARYIIARHPRSVAINYLKRADLYIENGVQFPKFRVCLPDCRCVYSFNNWKDMD